MTPPPFTLTWAPGQQTTFHWGGDPVTDDPDWPIVILLHGTSGTLDDMSNPAGHPGFNYDLGPVNTRPVDRGWHAYPGVGFWSVGVDKLKTVDGWQPFLSGHQIPSVNYQQVDADQHLTRPVVQLAALVHYLVTNYPTRRLAFLTHSRGGILLRAFLAQASSDLDRHWAGTVMLHAPNQGSQLANDALAAAGTLTQKIRDVQAEAADVGVDLSGAANTMITFVQEQIGKPAYQDYAVHSQVLRQLQLAEAARPPAMPVHTWGGISTRLLRVWVDWFTLESAEFEIVDDDTGWHIGFHWQTTMGGLWFWDGHWLQWILDDLPGISQVAPETIEGQGDVLVADLRAHLPFEVAHHTNSINHAQALWDPNVQQQALTALRTMRGHLAIPRLVAVLAAGDYGLPLGQPNTLLINCTDSVTGQPVDATVTIADKQVGHTNQPIGGVVYDPNMEWPLAWTEPPATDGPYQLICTTFRYTHYPPCEVSADGYTPVSVSLGPANDKQTSPFCIAVPPNTPVGVAAGLQQWIIQHGGDPAPEQSPVTGLEQPVWNAVRTQLSELRAMGAIHLAASSLGRKGVARPAGQRG